MLTLVDRCLTNIKKYNSIQTNIKNGLAITNPACIRSSVAEGQKLKSTYLLLGNVSLADTIIGISIIFGVSIEDLMSSSRLCVFQIGMIVCPAMVSIFSVGLIAVDRYIYILHGLYYQRWFNTAKVRIGILCIWLIGITLGFLPASGWVNRELGNSRCFYVSLFPGTLILLNSLLSIIPIILVGVLYSIILVRALKNVKQINAAVKTVEVNANSKPELRIYRGNTNAKKNIQSVKFPTKTNNGKLKRSVSFSGSCINSKDKSENNQFSHKSKSIDELNDNKEDSSKLENKKSRNSVPDSESNFSICTITSSVPDNQDQVFMKKESRKKETRNIENGKHKNKSKVKEPNKWRAITVVMLTLGSFIFTWMPFFITAIFFVFCQEKLTNPQCMHLRIMLSGPIATLAFLNSILNPLIYAWWHKGFQRSIRSYFQRYLFKFFRKDGLQ
ncbi:dopamine receptor 4-like isoform X2 [Maniola jurtina]|uniref:dopamine receptor 4-like isoform X2 n=1 Tax=Maniola jurtina TaxID=191418 RepID=UPI001E68D5B9|nr:dopamine receptor 4-like isoform X2 [Maniola jurtina]